MIVKRFKKADYKAMWDYQEEIALGLQKGEINDDYLLLVEHKPVYTIGRDGTEADLITSKEALKRRGIEIFYVNRGGKITFHGPGQLVGYPIMNLKRYDKDLLLHLRRIEKSLIQLLKEYEITADRVEGFPGVWVGNNKIAAVGIGVKRWVTRHGFALNVNTDLTYFQNINPCGFTDRGVTSMGILLQDKIDFDEVTDRYVKIFSKIWGVDVKEE